jgi:molybdopterin converting factor small subunit
VTISVLLFASAREAVGKRKLSLEVPDDGLPLELVLRRLGDDHPPLRKLLKVCRIARNGTYVDSVASRIAPGDELAVHPPYSGG